MYKCTPQKIVALFIFNQIGAQHASAKHPRQLIFLTLVSWIVMAHGNFNTIPPAPSDIQVFQHLGLSLFGRAPGRRLRGPTVVLGLETGRFPARRGHSHLVGMLHIFQPTCEMFNLKSLETPWKMMKKKSKKKTN